MVPGRAASVDGIQALRALAALCVVLYHIDFIGKGAFGVDLFFVISGFIICYVTAVDRAHFLAKRLIRIVPLYWTATLGVFFVALVLPGALGATTGSYAHLVQSLLFIPYEKEAGRVVPVLFLGWTLNYEMFFYALFALAMRTASPPHTACLLIATLVGFGQALPDGPVAWRFYTSPLLLEFCYGIAAYLVWRRFAAARRSVPAWLAGACACAAALLLLAIDMPMQEPLRFLAWGVPAALVVASVLVLETRLRFLLAAVAIGDASYSLYLLHPYVLKGIEKLLGPMSAATPGSALQAGLCVALAVAGALGCHRFFEAPATRGLRRLLIGQGCAWVRSSSRGA